MSAQSVTPQSYLTEPAFAPDRSEIAFVSGGDIWSVAAAGGVARLLVSHPANESRPLYAPDGKRLAFVSNRTGNGDIYVLTLDTGELRRVTFDDGAEQLDAWSPDGEWLWFSSTARDIAGMSDIFRVRAGGGTPMQFSADRYANEFAAAPAPDGASLAFSARGISNSQWWRKGRSHIDESEIWLWRETGYEQITQRGAKNMWPMWSADGSRLYFMSDRNGAQNLWTQPLKGAAKQLTNFTAGRVLWPQISRDGKAIVFERNLRLWTADTANGKAAEIPVTLRGASAGPPLAERVNLAGNIRELALSPDGKKVALIGRGEVFAASAKEGGDAVRITNTAAPESAVVWSTDSKRLVYASERSGAAHLYLYDFAAQSEIQLTNAAQSDAAPVFAPDGKSMAFFRNARALLVYDFAAKQEREVCKLYTDLPPIAGGTQIAWSPDSRWLAFATYGPESRSYTNISIAPAAGGTAQPVSFLADSNVSGVSWSPDGNYLLFDTNQRTEDGQLARVDLQPRTPKFREDSFRGLFMEENPRQPSKPATVSTPTPSPTVTPTPDKPVTDKEEDSPIIQIIEKQVQETERRFNILRFGRDPKEGIEVEFKNIRQRLSFIRAGVNVGGQVVSPDGKLVLLSAFAEGQQNFYTFPLDELAADASARQITSTASFKSQPQFTPDGKEVYYLENGRVQIATLERRESRPLSVNAEMTVAFQDEKAEIFRQGWRYLRDHFYDEKYHGADWNAVRATYEPYAAGARTPDELRRVMSLMVGELNASHLGVTGASGQQATPVGKLGLRFDRAEFEKNGKLRVTEIIAQSPAAVAKDIKVGDYLLAVDGANITAQTNLDELLEGKAGKRVALTVSTDGTAKREVVVKPVTVGAEKGLLYRQWVEANRAYVEKASGGKLGYVHLPDMSAGSLTQLYVDLDAPNQAKQGVVVDARNNNGGFINPYAIDVLARRGYLTMRERGLWNVPARSALGQRSLERPTILVTNQHSLSDAEDFSEGYRALKLGKIVGEPTAGWIIFTWNAALFDGTTIRLPRQLVLGGDGQNMELNPRPVDLPVTRPIGESLTGKDSQLDKAVGELSGQLR
jgi:Tol biopolymer transport system component